MEKQYLALLRHIKENGHQKGDRTGTGTKSIFGHQMRHSMEDGFPLLTTKKIHLKSVIYELLWKLSGNTNIKYLHDHGVTIWDEWADVNGEVGKVYGHQMRRFGETTTQPGFDYISWLQEEIKRNPDSRRLIMSLWNPHDIAYQGLPPCPCFYQFEVHDGKLSLQMYQRSADVFLGVPFNIAQDALLLLMMAQVTGLEAGDFIHTFGDVHIYNNHFEQVDLQLSREPKDPPTMILNPDVKNLLDFRYEDFTLVNYKSHPAIKAPVAV